jgi:hypothetical protein
MKRLHAVLLLAAVAAAAPVRADEATRSGFSLGARAAWAFPFGTAFEIGSLSVDMDDFVDRNIPLWLDATLRLGGGIEIGPYFQYGFVDYKDVAGVDQGSGENMRIGGQLNYRLTPAGGLTPWLGFGAGWEWLNSDGDDLNGFDVMVQGGADFRLTEHLALGPFVAFTVGRFSDVPSGADETWHEWLQVGAKLSFDL